MMIGTTLWVVPVLLIGLVLTVNKHEQMELEQVRLDVERVAETLTHSLERAPDGDEIPHGPAIVRMLGDLTFVENLRLIDAEGTIVFSTVADEIGSRGDPAEQAPCSECHVASGIRSDSVIYTNSTDRPVYHRLFPLVAEGPCLDCHGDGPREIGEALISLDVSHEYDEIRSYRGSASLVVLVTMVALIWGVWLLFEWIVRRPVRVL